MQSVDAACWKDERVSFKGEFFAFENLGVRPRPAAGTIPIWIGGHTERALRRVVTLGDGWHAAFPSADKLTTGIADLKTACSKAGRDPATLTISARLGLPARKSAEAQSKSRSGTVTIKSVAISKPEKELWPATDGSQAVTKLDLGRYLEAIGPSMIPHLKGRPCAILRAPDGIDQDTWLQRHAGRGLANQVSETIVDGEHKPWFQAGQLAGRSVVRNLGLLMHRPADPVPHERPNH